jgi:hypothetical protein
LQQQFGVVPQATTHPHAFTVPAFDRTTGNPNAATACASTSTTATAGRVRRRRVRDGQRMRPVGEVKMTVGRRGVTSKNWSAKDGTGGEPSDRTDRRRVRRVRHRGVGEPGGSGVFGAR